MEYIILIISLVGIVFGADFLVTGAVSIARKYKVSDFVIGAAIRDCSSSCASSHTTGIYNRRQGH
jgi:Ca2+/Na+ antiporter